MAKYIIEIADEISKDSQLVPFDMCRPSWWEEAYDEGKADAERKKGKWIGVKGERMRLIDGDALKEVIRSNAYVVDYSETGAIYGMYVDGIEYEIDAQPTIEPERKTGKWIGHREHCENLGVMPSGLGAYKWCSNCDCGIDVREWHRNNYNYCPNCGAKMEVDEE